MSKKSYIGIYAASLWLGLLIGVPCALLALFENYTMSVAHGFGLKAGDVLLPLYVLAVLSYLQFIVVQIIYIFIILSKMWGAIQDGQTPITAGKAIGYQFVPIFNLYWIFKAWGSFPTEYNKYIACYQLPVPRLSGGVFVAYPVLLLLTAFLYVPFLILPFVFMAIISKTCDAVNLLNQAVQDRYNAARQHQFTVRV